MRRRRQQHVGLGPKSKKISDKKLKNAPQAPNIYVFRLEAKKPGRPR